MAYLELARQFDQAAESVSQRLNRTVHALNTADVDYAVIGVNAVDLWLNTVGSGVKTNNVNILLRRSDIDLATEALSTEGFTRKDVGDHTMYLDEPNARFENAIHVLFAGEKYSADSLEPTPGVEDHKVLNGVRVINLLAFVKMKLTAGRSKDLGHLIELLKAGVISDSMIERIPESLRSRFQEVLLEREATRQVWE